MKTSVIDSVIVKARRIVELPDWSRTRLARESGLSPNALKGLSGLDFNPTAETMRKLEGVFERADVASALADSEKESRRRRR